MAYAFDKISDLMGQPNQSNIFAAQSGNPEAPGMAGAQQGAQPQQGVQRQAGGEEAGQGQGSSTVQGAGQGATVSQPMSEAAASRAIAGASQAKAPTALGDIKSGIDTSKQAALNEANAYVANSKAPGFDMGNATTAANYNKAVTSGDFSGINSILNPGASAPANFAPSKALDYTADIGRLGTVKGLAEEAAKGHGASYRGALGRTYGNNLLADTGYQKQLEDTKSAQSAAQKSIADATLKANADADKQTAEQQAAAKQSLLDFATQRAAGIKSSGERVAADAAFKLKHAADDVNIVRPYSDQIVHGIEADPTLLPYLDPALASLGDPRKYLTMDTTAPTWTDVSSPEKIQQYNNIQQLLGLGGIAPNTVTQGSYGGPQSRASFDTAKYTGDLNQLVGNLKSMAETPIPGEGISGGGSAPATSGINGLPTQEDVQGAMGSPVVTFQNPFQNILQSLASGNVDPRKWR